MTQILSTLRKTGHAAVVVLALGAATATAVPTPAMAHSPSFSFSIDLGGADLRLRHGDFARKFCLTNKQIHRGLRAEGFRNIDILGGIGRNRVEVSASFRGRFYLLVVDRCTGKVRVVERLGRRGPPSGGSFGLQFNFGM